MELDEDEAEVDVDVLDPESFVPLELLAVLDSELEDDEPLDVAPLLEVEADDAERESVMYQPLPLNTMPTG